MNLAILNRTLETGGTERQITNMARGLRDRGHQVTIYTYYCGGQLEPELKDSGVTVICLRKTRRWDVSFAYRLIKYLRKQKPDILYCFLPTSNVIGALIRPFIRKTRLVWGIRASNMALQNYDRSTQLSYSIQNRLSRLADLIISNSENGRQFVERQGMPAEKLITIGNGIDTLLYQPDKAAGKTLRSKWGVDESHRLIGLVGRIDPVKNHMTFLAAAGLLVEKYPTMRFVCVGGGDQDLGTRLIQQSQALGLENHLIWAGEIRDMPAVYNALDILCCCSLGEGFPNVVGEAMACGTPCVVADVGDCHIITQGCGEVFDNPQSREEIAQALENMHHSDQIHLARKSRDRIETQYSLTMMVERTEKQLMALL